MRDRGVDAIRGLAILAVILFHASTHLRGPAPDWWGWWSLGAMGVQVFFVVSGYLVALPWALHVNRAAAAPDVREYYLRRLRRIEPPWLICFAASWLALNPWDQRWLGEHVLPTVLYLHGVLLDGASPITPHSWSLEVEVRWYLVMPLVGQLLWLPWGARRAALIAFVGLCPGSAAHFLAGLLIADVRTRQDAHLPGWVAAAALLAVFPAAAAGLDLTPWLVALALMNPPRLGRPLELMGECCYSLYLWHILGQRVEGGPLVAIVANTATGIAAGAAGYVLIERPARLRWGRSRVDRPAPPGEVPARRLGDVAASAA